MGLKFTGELCGIRMKNDAKFEENLTCQIKIDMSIQRIFTRALENLKSLNFNELLLTKVYV